MDSDVKKSLSNSLLKEQGHLCAYCMCRIKGEQDVKIEHFEARTLENELQYYNLLAVCKGEEGSSPFAQHCDTKKKDTHIFISPLRKGDMKRIFYSNSGEIHSSDTTTYEYEYRDCNGKICKRLSNPNQDIELCLNLNYVNGTPLKGRKTALRQFQKCLTPYKNLKSIGDRIPVRLPDMQTRSFQLELLEVVFADQSIWNQKAALAPVEKQKNLADLFQDSELIKQYEIEAGMRAVYAPDEPEEDIWRCACGTWNLKEKHSCFHCGSEREAVFSAFDRPALEEKKEEHLEKEQKERKLAQEERKKSMQKVTKTAIIAFSSIAAVLLIFLLITRVISPALNYNHAQSLFKQK